MKALKGEDETDKVLEARLDRWWERASGARKQLDFQWFKYDLWVSGNHYAQYDKGTQQIITSPKMGGRNQIVVNKIYSTLRGVRSWTLQNQPKADITPYNLTEESIPTVAKLNQYTMYLHDRLRLRVKLRSSLWHALKYSVGYWQVLWNEEKQEIEVNVIDPYDLYWDDTARTEEEARFVILSVRRSIDDLKDDPKYKGVNWSEIGTDDKLSSSPFKERMIQYERGSSTSKGDKKDGTVLVKEFWYKETVEEEVTDEESGEKKKVRKPKIMLCTMASGQVIRKPVDTGLDRFPFFVLHSDVEPLSIYGNGWVKNLIPLNRLLNRLESSSAEYNDIVNKMRLHVEKGAGLRNMTNEHGTFVETKKGFMPTFMPVPALSAQLQQQIANVNRYIEDIGSLHDASLGRVPSGVKSGVGIEALQEGDSNNLSELTENIELFLEQVYEYIMYLASQKYQFAKKIVTTTTTGEKQMMTVIGEGANPALLEEGTLVIPEKLIVDVKITSWLAYTQEGRRMAVKDLVSLIPDLPPEFILEAYQTGNIADIVRKIGEQQKKKAEAEANQAKTQAEAQSEVQLKTQQRQGQIQQQQQLNTGAGKEAAIALIREIVEGSQPQLPPAVTPEFVAYIDDFINQSQAEGALEGELLSILTQYRDEAMMMVRGGVPSTSGGGVN